MSLLAGWALFTAAAAWVKPAFRADSASYFSYARSLFFDHDVDFANEWQHYGFAPLPRTATGLPVNYHSVGPALLWSPFYATAHVAVAVLPMLGAADGYSAAYRWSAVLGTLFFTVLGLAVLYRVVAARASKLVTWLAIAAAFLATPWAYYVFRVPWMAHGLSAAAMCFLIAGWWRVCERPDVRSWALLGAVVGVVALLRPQNVVVAAAFLLPLFCENLLRKRVGPLVPLVAVPVAFLVFIPQMLVWRSLFGRFLTMPTGTAFFDWSAPNLVNVLLSADRGLLTWTPLAPLALVGLAMMLFRKGERLFAGAALLAVGVAAWVNGSVLGMHGPEWAGADAFGARRFDVVFPLFAFGIARLLAAAQRRPLLAPATGVALLVLWNLGLARSYEAGAFPEGPAPFERVAATQAGEVRGAGRRFLGAVLGERGSALAYKMFVGEYLYYDLALDGRIDLGEDSSARFLRGGFGNIRRGEERRFRFALGPRSCLALPVDGARTLLARITARRAAGSAVAQASLLLNDQPVGILMLGPAWEETTVSLALRSGENYLCLSSPGAPQDTAVAGVALVQLP